MVESLTNGIDDFLIDGLSFKLPESATYVTDRKSVTFHTSGSNDYSATGTKLIKLVVNGDGWMDPSTLRIAFDVVNTHATADVFLRPMSGPWTFFRRLRILCGGTIVEDITEYNRVHEMFTTIINKNSKVNVDAEGWGIDPWDYKTTINVATFPGLQAGRSQTVIFAPLAGILAQPKYLPLRYAPLTFELELVSDKTIPLF